MVTTIGLILLFGFRIFAEAAFLQNGQPCFTDSHWLHPGPTPDTFTRCMPGGHLAVMECPKGTLFVEEHQACMFEYQRDISKANYERLNKNPFVAPIPAAKPVNLFEYSKPGSSNNNQYNLQGPVDWNRAPQPPRNNEAKPDDRLKQPRRIMTATNCKPNTQCTHNPMILLYCPFPGNSSRFLQCGPSYNGAGRWIAQDCPDKLVWKGAQCIRPDGWIAPPMRATMRPSIQPEGPVGQVQGEVWGQNQGQGKPHVWGGRQGINTPVPQWVYPPPSGPRAPQQPKQPRQPKQPSQPQEWWASTPYETYYSATPVPIEVYRPYSPQPPQVYRPQPQQTYRPPPKVYRTIAPPTAYKPPFPQTFQPPKPGSAFNPNWRINQPKVTSSSVRGQAFTDSDIAWVSSSEIQPYDTSRKELRVPIVHNGKTIMALPVRLSNGQMAFAIPQLDTGAQQPKPVLPAKRHQEPKLGITIVKPNLKQSIAAAPARKRNLPWYVNTQP